MEKIYTRGHSELLGEFFSEIGIGRNNRSNKHLIADGHLGFFTGDSSNYYHVNKFGLFDLTIIEPVGYIEVSVEYFIDYHRRRLNGEIVETDEINNYEIF
jgi:hypothetical protein